MNLLLYLSDNGRPGEKWARAEIAYDYRDAHGQLLFQVVRTDPKGFFQRQPKPDGGWINNLKGVARVPYRLPELIAADSSAPVLIAEGEKDVDHLVALGLVATCNAGGVSKWQDEYSEHLRSRHVSVLLDNDPAGRKHAQQVARSLRGTAASVRLVELPGLAEKGDVSDWLDAGGSKEGLLKIVTAADEWEPSLIGKRPAAICGGPN